MELQKSPEVQVTSHSAVSQTGRLAVRAPWTIDGQAVLAYVTGCQ